MVESKIHRMIEGSYKKLVLMKEMYGDMLEDA